MIPSQRSRLLARVRARIFGKEHSRNQVYGHARLLRRYAGAKLPYPVPGMLQHGWMLGCGEVNRRPASALEVEAHHFVWSTSNLKSCREWGIPRVTAIGAPLLYLPPTAPVEPESKSLVVFPFHIWERASFADDAVLLHERFLDQLQPLLGEFSPVTVCLYWMQYDSREIREVFLRRGLRVVTLGHRDGDPRFLWRFRELVTRHEYVTSNHFSTAVFYGLHLRRKAFIFGPTFGMVEAGHVVDVNHLQEIMGGRYPEMLWSNFDDSCHAEIAAEELGLEHRRSPQQLRELFGWGAGPLARSLARRAWRKVGDRVGRPR